MRSREQIQKDQEDILAALIRGNTENDTIRLGAEVLEKRLFLEVLLDIRELLIESSTRLEEIRDQAQTD